MNLHSKLQNVCGIGVKRKPEVLDMRVSKGLPDTTIELNINTHLSAVVYLMTSRVASCWPSQISGQSP